MNVQRNHWNEFKEYINSQDIGYIFNVKETVKLLDIPYATINIYRQYLTEIGILEYIKQSHYKIIIHIPERMNSNILFKLFSKKKYNKRDDWKSWFLSMDDKITNLLNGEKIRKEKTKKLLAEIRKGFKQ